MIGWLELEYLTKPAASTADGVDCGTHPKAAPQRLAKIFQGYFRAVSMEAESKKKAKPD
jgi:hypothetical protein